MNDIPAELAKYLEPDQRAEMGLLPPQLKMTEIADLWCQINGLPEEARKEYRYDLCIEMEKAVRKFLKAVDECKEIPDDALICEQTSWGVCADAWKPILNDDEYIIDPYFLIPEIRKDNLEKWARNNGKWNSVIASKLKGWFTTVANEAAAEPRLNDQAIIHTEDEHGSKPIEIRFYEDGDSWLIGVPGQDINIPSKQPNGKSRIGFVRLHYLIDKRNSGKLYRPDELPCEGERSSGSSQSAVYKTIDSAVTKIITMLPMLEDYLVMHTSGSKYPTVQAKSECFYRMNPQKQVDWKLTPNV